MAENHTKSEPQDDGVQAFEALRGEVSLVRAAVEGLTAARDRIPDHSETLGQMLQGLKNALARLDHIEKSPAIALSPEAMGAEIIKASAAARAADVRLLHDARDTLSRTMGRIDGAIERRQAADQEVYWLAGGAVFMVLLGAFMWSVFSGPIARSLPESWHVPEWMAARTMDMDQKSAGVRMIATATDRRGNEKLETSRR